MKLIVGNAVHGRERVENEDSESEVKIVATSLSSQIVFLMNRLCDS